MLPSVLYQPTEYDFKTGANASRYLEVVETSFAAVAQSYDFATVPANKILVITGWEIHAGASSGGVEFLTTLEMLVLGIPPNNNRMGLLFIRTHTNAGFGREAAHYGHSNLWLMPGEHVRAVWGKSGAVDTFTITTSLHGFYIPRANIQSG